MEQGGNRIATILELIVKPEGQKVLRLRPGLVPLNAVALGKVVRFKIVAIDKQDAVIACVRPLSSERWDWIVELLGSSNAAY
jgi:hypothetical protein